MASFLIPILMVLVSGGLFMGFVAPGYDDVKLQRAEIKQYDEALARFEELKELRDKLEATYKDFLPEDVQKLITILPDNLDNIRFALDLDNIADKNGVRILALEIAEEETKSVTLSDSVTPVDDSLTLGTAMLEFEIEGLYGNMVNFLKDLEKNLRLVDITSLTLEEATENTASSYTIGVRMYWLK